MSWKHPAHLGGVVVAALVVLTALAVGIHGWRSAVKERNAERMARQAQIFQDEGRHAEALVVFNRVRREHLDRARLRELERAELLSIVEAKDYARLQALYERDPARVLGDEAACQLRARQLIYEGDLAQLEGLVSRWKDRSDNPEWQCLAVMLALRRGEAEPREEAGETGEEAGHLFRAIREGNDREAAWNHLLAAYQDDPENPDTRTFLGNMLESRGALEAAQREYVAAHLLQPENPVMRDNLAEFYRRHGRLGSAIETWTGGDTETLPSFVWIKADFWSRVYEMPAQLPRPAFAGYSAEVARCLQAVPPDDFWSEEAEWALRSTRKTRGLEGYLFWLRIIDRLQNDRFAEARTDLMMASPESRNFHPALFDTLKYLVRLRTAEDGERVTPRPLGRKAAALSPFFASLNRPEEREELRRFCEQPEALSAAFFAAGWIRAGLKLTPATLSGERPDWYDHSLASALWRRQGAEAALARLDPDTASVDLQRLRAEILLTSGQREAGLAVLDRIRREASPSGERAAWLCFLAAMEEMDLNRATAIVDEQPRYTASVAGVELRATIAMARGDTERARELYSSIRDDSAHAAAELSKMAYREGDRETAREMTHALSLRMPLHPVWERNLSLLEEEPDE